MNEDAINKLSQKINQTCKDQWKEVGSYIEKINEFQLPTYNQLKDPEFFLETSSYYTQLSTTNYYYKVKLSKIIIDITTLLDTLAKCRLNSILNTILQDLKVNKERCALYINSLEEYQKSINKVLDYLKLYSYTANSPYNV